MTCGLRASYIQSFSAQYVVILTPLSHKVNHILVRMMAELAAGWAKTVTSVNLAHLTSLTSMDSVMDSLSLPVCAKFIVLQILEGKQSR